MSVKKSCFTIGPVSASFLVLIILLLVSTIQAQDFFQLSHNNRLSFEVIEKIKGIADAENSWLTWCENGYVLIARMNSYGSAEIRNFSWTGQDSDLRWGSGDSLEVSYYDVNTNQVILMSSVDGGYRWEEIKRYSQTNYNSQFLSQDHLVQVSTLYNNSKVNSLSLGTFSTVPGRVDVVQVYSGSRLALTNTAVWNLGTGEIVSEPMWGTVYSSKEYNQVIVVITESGIYQSSDFAVTFEVLIDLDITWGKVEIVHDDWMIIYGTDINTYLLHRSELNTPMLGPVDNMLFLNSGTNLVPIVWITDGMLKSGKIELSGLNAKTFPRPKFESRYSCNTDSIPAGCGLKTDELIIDYPVRFNTDFEITEYQRLTVKNVNFSAALLILNTQAVLEVITTTTNSTIQGDGLKLDGYLVLTSASNHRPIFDGPVSGSGFRSLASTTGSCYLAPVNNHYIKVEFYSCGSDEMARTITVKGGVECINSQCRNISPILNQNLVINGSFVIKNTLSLNGYGLVVHGNVSMVPESKLVLSYPNNTTATTATTATTTQTKKGIMTQKPIIINGNFEIDGELEVEIPPDYISDEQELILIEFIDSNNQEFTSTTLPECSELEYRQTQVALLFSSNCDNIVDDGVVSNEMVYLITIIGSIIALIGAVGIGLVFFRRQIFPYRYDPDEED